MLTLEKLLRMYEMPPGRGGQSGNRGKGSSSSSSGRGSGSRGSGRSSVSGATRGNIGAKTGRSSSKSGNNNQGTRGSGGAYSASTSRAQNKKGTPSKSSVSGATRGNISAKTKNTPNTDTRGNVTASDINKALGKDFVTGDPHDATAVQGYFDNTSVTNPAAFDNSAISGATRGNISAKVDPNKNAVNTAFAKLGDGFRQMAIDTFGAEPGIEGYDKDGNYGFGYNSTYGQQLLAGDSGIRAKGNLSLDQQKQKAADYDAPDPLLKGVFDGVDLGFDINTDGFFDKFGSKLTGFIFGKAGAALLSGLGPWGALAGTILGGYFGGKFHDTFANRDTSPTTYSGPKGVPHLGLNQAAYDAYLGAQGLYDDGGGAGKGKGTINYQARLDDFGHGDGQYHNPNAIMGQGGQGGGQGGNGGGASDDDIIVDDGTDNPNTTLDEYLDDLKKDRDKAMAAVRLQERQAEALKRISSRRYYFGTSYNRA